MKDAIREAFLSVCERFSPDRVVADPELNANFLRECVRLGLQDNPADLNRKLLNLRKAGELRGIKSKRTTIVGDDAYRFAAEMAIRHVEQKYQLSLDAVICDLQAVLEFDQIASQIAPGYSPLMYRWAALRLRKTSRLKPEVAARLLKSEMSLTVPVASLVLDDIPTTQGVYIFFTGEHTLYVGESENLRNRIRKHLDHSDNKELAKWLWATGIQGLHLEYRTLPSRTSTRDRRALENELIRTRNPEFNVKR